MNTARITKVSQPRIAFLRCCALQRPARAARFWLRVTVSPLAVVGMPRSLRPRAPPSNAASTRAAVRVTERAPGSRWRFRIRPVPPPRRPGRHCPRSAVLRACCSRSRRPRSRPGPRSTRTAAARSSSASPPTRRTRCRPSGRGARRGFVLELDVKLTKDLVPVVIHDATLDRTTPCTGQVSALTFADLRANCPLGHPGHRRRTSCSSAANDRRRAPIPQADRGARAGRDHGRAHEPRDQEPARATPTSTTRPPTPTTVIDAIKAVGVPAVTADHPVLLVPEPRPGEAADCRTPRRASSRSAAAAAAAVADGRRTTGSRAQWPLAAPLRRRRPRRSACGWSLHDRRARPTSPRR